MNVCFFEVEYKIAMNLKLVKREVHCEFRYLGCGISEGKRSRRVRITNYTRGGK